MVGPKYTCPLCHQPVSNSLYMQIMGIWKAKEKELVKIKTERVNLKKMQKQFKNQKSKLIKSAVEKNIGTKQEMIFTSCLERKLPILWLQSQKTLE